MDPLILILIIVSALVLASLPFIHRAWTRRGGVPGEVAPERERPSIVDTTPPDLREAPTVEAEPEPLPEVVEEPPSFFARLGKARSTVAGYFGSVLSRGVDNDTWDELEEALIRADVGVADDVVCEQIAKAHEALLVAEQELVYGDAGEACDHAGD